MTWLYKFKSSMETINYQGIFNKYDTKIEEYGQIQETKPSAHPMLL